MRLLIALTALVVSACAAQSGYWDHPHQDRVRFDKDRHECLYEAAKATASAPASASLSQNIAQDIATGTRQADLLVLCMTARGYTFVPQ